MAKKISKSLTLLLMIVILTACSLSADTETPAANLPKETTTKVPKEPPPPRTITIAAMGDLMMHSDQIQAGKQADGSYQYDSFFTEIEPYLKEADLAIANFETTLAGEERPYSGYPRFHAPDAFADAVLRAGFDLVTTANNHSMDTGEKGVIRTYTQLKKSGLIPVGTAPTAAEQKPVIVEKNGIKLAFLAYAEHTNGLPVPAEKQYLVNLIDPVKMKKDIELSKELGAEAVIVGLHFGPEYQRSPSEQQQKIVEQAFKFGADVVLGGHPHVLQPMKQTEVEGEEKFVIYSMGNAISGQTIDYTDEGILVYVTLTEDPHTKQISFEKASYIPTYRHKYTAAGKRHFSILPITSANPTFEDVPQVPQNNISAAWKNTTTLMEKHQAFPVFSPTAETQK
ncbi:CapA family protein [Mechercharimyces sp. CAU 1602]|uniref:CapA family protein n=1 Tax=Mechercharimyces sp. CAU 1602 TaxID=2973933 RepID=UPI0021611C25|nr:CapA family protein [Mechercharimyces sp. CAU 1602]MCS1351197.1 CapA family protein [Mechercharimyces sp. CAU 1602]